MMPNRPSTVHILLAAVAVVPFSWPATILGAEPAAPLLNASRFLGPEGEDLGAERVAAAISRAGVPARAAGGKWTTWRQPPAEDTPWLCGATAGFGERAHAYVFWFNASGTPERLAHVPYGKTTLPLSSSRVWLAPIDSIADAIAHGSASQQVSGPAVRIKIVREEATGEAGPVVNPDLYEAIAWAAACEAGWTPTPSTAPAEATLAVAAGVKSASLRLAIESEGRRRELVKRSVSEDDLHAVLRRMFSCLADGSVAADFFRIDADAISVSGPGGAVEVLHWRPQFAEKAPAGGPPKPLAPLKPTHAWSFDREGSRVVVASGTAVAMFKDAQELWRHSEPDAITCGPIFAGPLVVAGTAEGELFAVDGDTGRTAWKQSLERGLVGRPAVAAGKVVAYCREGDAIVAADVSTGKKTWSQPLGDVPIGPVVAIHSGLLVASKSNRIVLLDPETGRVRAERTLPGWIVDVVPLPGKDGRPAGRIAALTRDGAITLLAAADLEPEGRQQLDGRPGYDRAAGFIRAQAFPTAWPGPIGSGGEADELDAELESSMADRADCLLADDEEGYAWIIPLSRLVETSR